MQKPRRVLILLTLAVFTGVGCASHLLSDERLRSSTAGLIGARSETITISDRREQMSDTRYTATTSSGQIYDCVIDGGGIFSFGMVNLPGCSRR
jgi:hypothetical protein